MNEKLLPGYPAVDFWRSLHYFNLYRLAISSLFVILAVAFANSISLGTRNWKLFYIASVIYLAVAVLSFIPLKIRWPRFSWQLAGQVGSDIIGLSVLSYASGGIQSNIGLLLLVSLAAAGLISRGKITLLFASLASIAALLQHSYDVLYDDGQIAHYVQVGLLCISYFAVAWLAHTLAQYAVDSQLLAQRRGHDLASLTEASHLVMRDMKDGVLVVDDMGVIMQMNQSAARLLHQSALPGSLLAESFPLLFGQYALWKRTGTISSDTLLLDVGVPARLRFVAVERDAAHGVVIFLEDMQRIRAEAQQIKLAALGRLTASIAHEVRNPLSAISYATELMGESLAETAGNALPATGTGNDKHAVNQGRLLKIVMDNTKRINRIVQDVMQLNRRDRAQTEILNLDMVLSTFVEEFLLTERLEAGVITLEGSENLQVTFDRGHLRQVLWNLTGNAFRYGRKLPGSVKLTRQLSDGRILLDVIDDGLGVDVELRSKLFEPFFTTAADGTGLGLYIAKELCDANDAQLEYYDINNSEHQTGACFRITFGKLVDKSEEIQ